MPKPNPAVKEVLVSENDEQPLEAPEIEPEQLIVEEIIDEDSSILIDDQIDKFEENIYHSKLAEREELHYGNKWVDRVNLKEELFTSRQSLRRSIIVKEILDKPLAMRD